MSVKNVLLVDDEMIFAEAMAKRLVKRGFKVFCAFTGRQALEQLETQPNLDVVILDVKMPGIEAIEALREIKKRRPLVEVIILTGHASVMSAVEGMRSGAMDYLMKPCDIEDLVSKINEAVTIKRGRENRLLQTRMKPYISPRTRDRMIFEIERKAVKRGDS